MKILICGSGHSIKQVDEWDTSTHFVVAVNNAWNAVDWDAFCCTNDYVRDYNKAVGFPQVTNKDVPDRWWNQDQIGFGVKDYGGPWQVGMSVTLSAAYIALKKYGSSISTVGFIGCDMSYPSGQTAYYGTGIDFEKRKMSDPDWMIMQTQKNNIVLDDGVNLPGGKPSKDMSVEEIRAHYYNRFANISKEKYNIDVVNYSHDSETLLPYPQVEYNDKIAL